MLTMSGAVMSNNKKPENRWKDFHAEHEERREAGIVTRILTLLFFTLGGATVGGVLGFFITFGPRHRRIQHLMEDTPEKIKFRVIVGAIIGAIAAIIFVIRTWRSMKD